MRYLIDIAGILPGFWGLRWSKYASKMIIILGDGW
jgi:hypothetical protein